MTEQRTEPRVFQWLRRICKPNGPDGYRWTDEDVLDEKIDAFFNGLIFGVLISAWITLVILFLWGLTNG